MKLPPAPKLDIAQQIEEFDIWITPSLGEIRDSDRFEAELDRIAELFDALAERTRCFGRRGVCTAAAVAEAVFELAGDKSPADAFAVLHSAAALLFLATGKSDNNAKCQFPLHLRDVAHRSVLPALRKVRGKPTLTSQKLPRTLKADKYMLLAASLADYPEEQLRLLRDFASFVLSDDRYVSQLWSIGHSYVMLKPMGKSRDLLTPLVMFQVRGSVTASGGHAPEQLLRQRFDEWGMVPGVDFNLRDVVIDKEIHEQDGRSDPRAPLPLDESDRQSKTRAYDFVLPYRTPSWERTIFVQCQFYAGDSGSVSHKNLDQTDTSRRKVEGMHTKPAFVEYVDGAGYFASLNGDLKKLLQKPSTADFFQVRSAPVRLRRILQQIGFVTPLELEHAVELSDGTKAQVARALRRQGYARTEIDRAVSAAVERGQLLEAAGSLAIVEQRREVVRRYLLLDTVACAGRTLNADDRRGFLLVPGYGAFHGMRMADAVAKASAASAATKADWSDSSVLMRDIEWLVTSGFMMTS